MGESLLDVTEYTREQRAALQYLKHSGYEVLEPDGYESRQGFTRCDIVARDAETGDLHFIQVMKPYESMDDFTPCETWGYRAGFENLAQEFLSEHDYIECRVIPSVVAFLLIEESRALLRFHQNAPLQEFADDDEEEEFDEDYDDYDDYDSADDVAVEYTHHGRA